MKAVYDLVHQYCKDYEKFRTDNGSLSNLDFHNEFGFWLKTPFSWKSYEVIGQIIESTKWNKVAIIYDATDDYNVISKSISELSSKPDVAYMSWHRIYVGMFTKQKDVRPINSINAQLKVADLVVVVGASKVEEEVINHIQFLSSGCLICLE